MKHFMFALPAVAMVAGAALAQTDTTTGTGTETGATTGMSTDATGGMYGTNWPLSVGTTFFTDADSATLRATDEVTAGWQSLSQEDRDMIKADCTTFMAAHGDAAMEGSASTDAASGTATDTSTTGDAATTATGTDAATTATGTDAATTGTSGTDTAATTTDAGAATTAAAGYDMAEMKAICEAVETL